MTNPRTMTARRSEMSADKVMRRVFGELWMGVKRGLLTIATDDQRDAEPQSRLEQPPQVNPSEDREDDAHDDAADQAGGDSSVGAGGGPNETPKKLQCGHIFHFHCLRSWLERQQSCPTW